MKSRNANLMLLVMCTVLAQSCVCIGAASLLVNPPGIETNPFIWTDQGDYAPGTTARIFAKNFSPGESVTLQVLHADGTPDSGDDHQPWNVAVAGDGTFESAWHVCEDDCLGSTLLLSARDSASSVQWLFTDNTPSTVAENANLTVAWGLGDQGQLGDGIVRSSSPYGSSTPVSVASLPGGRRIESVAAGTGSSVAIADDTTLWAWGSGGFGQLGNGTYASSSVPLAVNALPAGRRAVAISAGLLHILVLADDGTLWAWGYGMYGQLGDGTFRTGSPQGSSVPVAVSALPDGRKAVAIAAGAHHNLALADDGTVWSWGDGEYGQLGDGTFRTASPYGSSTPVAVTPLPGGRKPIAIAAGQIHSLALADDGTIWAWGDGENGQLGDGTFRTSAPYGSSVPVMVGAFPEGRKGVAITAGAFHNLALADDGTLWSWGYGKGGELGDGTFRSTAPYGSSSPVEVSTLPGGRFAVEIAASYGSLALANDGSIWCWGSGLYGQLGDGTFRTVPPNGSSMPVQVIGLPSGKAVLSIAAGTLHNFALLGDVSEPSIVWASPGPIVYGMPLTAAQLNATATHDGVTVPGTFIYSPPLGTILNAGDDQTLSVTFLPSDASAFASATASVKINVSKAPLTVTANDQFKPYGGLMPQLTVRYDGFVNGESEANLLSQAVASTSATESSDFGQYPIIVSSASSQNYEISYVSGNLTVYWLSSIAGPLINPANLRRYYMLDVADWFASESAAQLRGGHLVTIRNQAENDYIYNNFGGPWLWTGLYDADLTVNSPDPSTRSAEFAWTSGEPVTYTHWSSGEPNNYNGLGEFYGLILPPDWAVGGFWNDGGGGFWANGVAEIPPPSVIAGPIINPSNGHEYYLLDSSDWAQSEAVAQAMGGHLATIRSQAEQDFVFNTFASFGGVARHLYIGLYDANHAENSVNRDQRQVEFAWVSGESVTYANWAAAEPNNFQRAGEFWGHMLAPSWEFEGETLTSNGEWNDISDSSNFGAPLNAVVEIVPPNHPPSSSDRAFTISESTSIGITLVNFGSDPDGDSLTYAIVEQPLHGSLVQSELGVAYTPFDGFTGSDSFKYKLIDTHGAESAAAQVSIAVNPIIPQITSISPDTRLLGSGGFTLAVQGSSFIRGVEVLWNGTPRPTTYGSFGYITAAIPASDLEDPADRSVEITVRTPGGGISNPASFIINRAPTAYDYPLTITEGTTVTFMLPNIGLDPDGDPLTYSIVEAPVHGSFVAYPTAAGYTPAEGFTGVDTFKFKLIDSHGAESSVAQVTITVEPLIPRLDSISPGSALVGSAGFTLGLQGAAFLQGAEVLWNGSPRPTTFGSHGYLTAQIAAGDITSTPDLSVVQVTVRNPGGGVSSPLLFTIKTAAVGESDSAIAPPGGSTTVSAIPTSGGESGVSATAINPDGSPLIVSAAVYSGTPPSGLVIDAGGSYYDLKVSGADANDSLSARFYYPNTVVGSAENKLRLTFFNGHTWLPVRSSGNENPLKDTTDDLDQTVSGGRFSVLFDNTSTPKITELSGTVFGLANTTPTVAVSGPAEPLAVDNTAMIDIDYFAIGTPDSQNLSVNWGDGSVSSALASLAGHSSASHNYTSAGVYSVTVTVTDANGDTGAGSFEYVVVYNPSGGFVVGGGWISSPAGAYPAVPDVSGRANFGFTSKYNKGATVPSGQTQFQFQMANLNFHSTAYDWLVISGARAQFKGVGTINGTGEFGFILTAIDGQVTGGGGYDRFRIKIWDKASSAIIYDNQIGAGDTDALSDSTRLGGGSIVLQK